MLSSSKTGRRLLSRTRIFRCVINSFDERDCEDISVTELATTIGVSERTLRAVFQEHCGMPPVRYLKLRTLGQVRKALEDPDSSVTTVTQIATKFGIWELGRFAREYRALFGELPSETLRRTHQNS